MLPIKIHLALAESAAHGYLNKLQRASSKKIRALYPAPRVKVEPDKTPHATAFRRSDFRVHDAIKAQEKDRKIFIVSKNANEFRHCLYHF